MFRAGLGEDFPDFPWLGFSKAWEGMVERKRRSGRRWMRRWGGGLEFIMVGVGVGVEVEDGVCAYWGRFHFLQVMSCFERIT